LLTSSDSFFLNFCFVFLKLNFSFSKSPNFLKNFSPSFWYSGCFHDFSQETPVHQSEEVKNFISENEELRKNLLEDVLKKPFDFNETFVISGYSLHLGIFFIFIFFYYLLFIFIYFLFAFTFQKLKVILLR
jgi:hypothetical protein